MDLLSIVEASVVLHIKHRTLRRWIHQGRLPVVRLSRQKVLVSREALDKFIADNTGRFTSKGKA